MEAGGAAPYLGDIADGPPGGAAAWLRAADGVRVRAVHWPAAGGGRGTVLLFPGRTEYCEKYGPVAGALTAAGLDVLAIDWRGQGLAERLHGDPALGHVARFADYQLDVDALVSHAEALGVPGPRLLLAHSMGGAIGLAALHAGLAPLRAAFSAPMWGIGLAARLRPVAWALSWAARRAGHGDRYAPGRGPATAETILFETNPLTTDPYWHAWMQAQVDAHPALSLGGPSLQWLIEALSETRRLRALPPPDVPALIGIGTAESIVDVAAIQALARDWPGARLQSYEGARHELLMEAPSIRGPFLSDVAAFLAG